METPTFTATVKTSIKNNYNELIDNQPITLIKPIHDFFARYPGRIEGLNRALSKAAARVTTNAASYVPGEPEAIIEKQVHSFGESLIERLDSVTQALERNRSALETLSTTQILQPQVNNLIEALVRAKAIKLPPVDKIDKTALRIIASFGEPTRAALGMGGKEWAIMQRLSPGNCKQVEGIEQWQLFLGDLSGWIAGKFLDYEYDGPAFVPPLPPEPEQRPEPDYHLL